MGYRGMPLSHFGYPYITQTPFWAKSSSRAVATASMGCATSKVAATAPAGKTHVDLDRYTKPMSIWVALMTGHVRLVKMSWLIKHAKAKGILSRRQELPEEAFFSVDELKRMYGNGNRDGVLPIIAISFCWLTASHPDPEGKQLATVAAMMEKEQAKYAQLGFSDMGVFWDWLSIYQKDAKGERSEEENKGFHYALHETMDLWYAQRHGGQALLAVVEAGSVVVRDGHQGHALSAEPWGAWSLTAFFSTSLNNDSASSCRPSSAGMRTRARQSTCSPSCPRTRRAKSRTQTRGGPPMSGARRSRLRSSSSLKQSGSSSSTWARRMR